MLTGVDQVSLDFGKPTPACARPLAGERGTTPPGRRPVSTRQHGTEDRRCAALPRPRRRRGDHHVARPRVRRAAGQRRNEDRRMIAEIRGIGWKAHAALARSAGRWTNLPGFAGSAFRLAGGEPIFLGSGNVAMHPRAVVFHPHIALPIDCCVQGIVPWRSAPLSLDDDEKRSLHAAASRSPPACATSACRRDWPSLLAGHEPAFPLDHATRACEVARECHRRRRCAPRAGGRAAVAGPWSRPHPFGRRLRGRRCCSQGGCSAWTRNGRS